MNTKMMAAVLGVLSVAMSAGAESAQMCVSGMEQAIASGTDAVVPMSFVLPRGATVTGVVVDLELDHDWLGDLVIQIEHGGTVVTLMDRVNIELFPFGCGGRDLDASFRDDAAATPGDLCVPSTPNAQPEPMLVGDLRPEGMLSGFSGMDPSGAWTVTVSDQAANDAGVLRAVCITLEFDAPPPVCAGDVDGSGGVDVDDLNAVLGAWGTSVGVGDPRDLANDDGLVDVDDLNVILGNWGVAC